MAGKFNLSQFFGMSDLPDTPETQQEKPQTSGRKNNVVSLQSGPTNQNKIVLLEPRIYSDAKQAGGFLINNQAVIVNFNKIDASQATRIVDFLTGTVFAINGEIKRVGEEIFLCTPPNYQVDGDLDSTMNNNLNDEVN